RREGERVSRFRRKLLAWYARAARDLPWRRTRDPYAVVVSEVMLQQTQVSRVTEYFPRFMARFPTLRSLARSKPKAVMEAWDGLGYYARARNLHALAREVTQRHDGTLPDQPEELVELPGVGPYTAGAVACFAYEKAVAAVDTNVARVLRRVFFGIRDTGYGIRGRGAADASRIPHPASRDVWELAAAIVPGDGKRAWRFNQAMMELGALVCTARKPRCPQCPVNSNCRTFTTRRTDAPR
ncbi:MAG: A/G-specific adenine glycosylase, partial [Gemmatimonadales bacterium]